MYRNNINQNSKDSFHQQHPFFSTCSPDTLHTNETATEVSYEKLLSYRSKPVVIPINTMSIPIMEVKSNDSSPSSAHTESIPTKPSSYWQWTFGLTTFPFVFWGCPFYLLVRKHALDQPLVRTTRHWLIGMFPYTFPFTSILTVILMIWTTIMGIYLIYLFSTLFKNLFISGVYEKSMFRDIIEFIRNVPVLMPLICVWLRGFRVNNIVCLLDQKHGRFGGIGCNFGPKLVLMMLVIVCIHTIRFFSYEKYSSIQNVDFLAIVDTVSSFSTDVFVSFMFPVYCTFCYSIRFELFIIKGMVYKLISKREVPDVSHLSKFKTLYTHAADHIVTVNNLFSLYMSVAILLMIIGTIFDAENLVGVIGDLVSGIFGGGSVTDVFNNFVNATQAPPLPPLPLPPTTMKETNPTPDMSLSGSGNETVDLAPAKVRMVNADITCIILVYILIFFTVWQAVGTNDLAREVHVWLNDFVSGGGGTDVKNELMDLGIKIEKNSKDSSSMNHFNNPFSTDDIHNAPLIWGANKKTDDGFDDEFLNKFRLLKSYIHVRMQLEKPALLYITLVGLIIPSLSGRLRRYSLMF